MNTHKILALATCFNRREKTVSAISALIHGNSNCSFTFLIADDASTDGTSEALKQFSEVTVLHGDGKQFYCGGMRMAIAAAQKKQESYDWVLLFNDDVQFYDHAIDYLASKSKQYVWAGPTCDPDGKLVYSGILRLSKFRPKYQHIKADAPEGVRCDTLNGNCVLIPWHIFLHLDNMPAIYRQSFGDYDYGFMITRKGYEIRVSDQFAGMCKDDTPIIRTWQDTSLSFRERKKLKESVKGLPFKEYFYYLNHNFGFLTAVIYSLSPYVKMVLGK